MSNSLFDSLFILGIFLALVCTLLVGVAIGLSLAERIRTNDRVSMHDFRRARRSLKPHSQRTAT